MLRGNRDDHRRELRALRLADCHCVRQRDLVQFPMVVDNQFVVEPYRDFRKRLRMAVWTRLNVGGHS